MFKKLAASLATALSFASCVPMVPQGENLKQGNMPGGYRESGSSSGYANSYGTGGRVTRNLYDPSTGQYARSVISGNSNGRFRATTTNGGPNGYSSVTITDRGVYFSNRFKKPSRYDLKRQYERDLQNNSN